MPELLRVAVIGAGQMGAFHIETYERLPEAELVAVADPDEVGARAVIGRRPVSWPRWKRS
jgi:predicted dehydrogenase